MAGLFLYQVLRDFAGVPQPAGELPPHDEGGDQHVLIGHPCAGCASRHEQLAYVAVTAH